MKKCLLYCKGLYNNFDKGLWRTVSHDCTSKAFCSFLAYDSKDCTYSIEVNINLNK